jgi:hypothetical protein
MAAVADLERFLERMFERTSARVFRARVQVVQVDHRVERAMEAARSGRGASTAVPSRYRVRLHPADLDDLAARSGGADALAGHLADQALAFARLHGYHLAARPTISLVADPSVERGRVEVDAQPREGHRLPPNPADPSAVASGPAQSTGAPGVPPTAAATDFDPSDSPVPRAPAGPLVARPEFVASASLVAPAPADPTGPPPAAAPPLDTPPGAPSHSTQSPAFTPPSAASIRGDGDRRQLVRPSAPPPTRAVLRVTERGGRERAIVIDGAPLTLGRAPDNGLVITDGRVSRHHGRFRARHGTLVYTDLGSTNGPRVNGIRVDEIVLGVGDRLAVGDAVVVVEQLPG